MAAYAMSRVQFFPDTDSALAAAQHRNLIMVVGSPGGEIT